MGFVEPLREYLATADRYFPFTEAGANGLADGIVNRLRMTEDLQRHPCPLHDRTRGRLLFATAGLARGLRGTRTNAYR